MANIFVPERDRLGARCNARIDAKGRIIRAGEQVMVGANESYISLCRKHFNQGKTKK